MKLATQNREETAAKQEQLRDKLIQDALESIPARALPATPSGDCLTTPASPLKTATLRHC